VVTGPGSCEVRELAVPDLPDDAALLRVEAAGICGSDVRMFAAEGRERILGHENYGVIAEIGRVAKERWGVTEGDRVAVEEYLPCGHCAFCRGRDFRLCDECDPHLHAEPMRFGSTPVATAPGLWGGFSQYLYLHPRSILHKVTAQAPARQLAMALPIGNGFEWAYFYGGVGPSKTVVVYGPGQQGLGCVVAAKEAGADCIIVIGRPRDAERLAVAEALGADHTTTAEGDAAVEEVRRVTNGEMADVVLDTAAGSTATVVSGIKMLRKQGRLLCPTAMPEGIEALPLRLLQSKCLSLVGVRGHSFEAVEMAIDLIGSQRYPLEKMTTHSFGLPDVGKAIGYVAGNGPAGAVHLSITPWE
jgi:threonine dehydrogenase-like Zn-dependent dehydrogenase